MSRSRWADWVEPGTTTLRLEPTFGVKSWSATSTCADVHPRGPMPSGTSLCCMACHGSGRERHPDLEITAKDKIDVQRWRPDGGRDPWSAADTAEPTSYRPSKPGAAKTRKQRRAEAYGRDGVATIDPETLARQVDSGRARPLA